MIRKLAIQNFRCIRAVDVELAPLTAFVGPNASGKSAFLAALNPELNLADNRRFRGNVEVVVRADGATRRAPVGHGTAGRFTYQYQLLRLDLRQLRQPNQVAEQSRLFEDGSNLLNVFETIGRQRQEEIARRLCELVPVFRDLDTIPHGQGSKRFRFHDRWSETTTYAPDEVSDGTMLVLAFLLIPYQQPSVDVLCIEEPERGLHPYLMNALVEQLRALSTGGDGRPPVQILLATQSAEFLNHLRPDEVRFLRRDASDGSVIVETPPTSTPEWRAAFEEYEESLGHLWLAGGLGGVPGSS